MLFDWFTTIAQVVNFIILLIVLKYLLYDRVLKAIDRRREQIDTQRREAREARAEAEEEAERYREQRTEIEQHQDRLMREAREEAENRRDELMEEAREDVERRRMEWKQSLDSEKERLVERISAQVARSALDVTERMLADLADEDLHRAIARHFLRYLRELSDQERSRIAGTIGGNDLVVSSSFVLDDDLRSEISQVVGDELGVGVVDFEVDHDLVAGMRLSAGGRYVGWSVRDYADELADELTADIGARSEEDRS